VRTITLHQRDLRESQGERTKRYMELWEKHLKEGKCLGNKYNGDEVYLCTKKALHNGKCGDWLFWYAR